MKVVNGFKDFILRGNVIDLAVAVVIGAAFSGIITSIVDNLITPLIAAIGGAPNTENLWIVTLNGAEFKFGAIIGAIINFLIIAAAVYFVIVLPVNRLLALRKKGEVEAPKAPTEDVLLLTEIRDLLARQTGETTRTLDT
ncbi:large conductance mechanosensitive channel protein MscL [Kineococcus rhizosphaerae]|uniref:Large-conductance mechanosensitive channel n=1 Tax=Kineococcus rhizosphaerae TaxID=559628 RepID=A0A2T0QZK6_9ACTN|nr:large conductance mechanosensitive channel protein MscL [Kineococcus rhizosphaerae]PRY12128.1 large conductance mechanosensitive channel [Kineococcus rhizosphaerae]